jgi:MFS family permease
MKPPIQLQQERDFGQKINVTFEFIIQNFKPLMLSLLYIAGPPALIGGFFMGAYQSNMLSLQQQILGSDDVDSSLSSIYSMGSSMLLLFIFLGAAGLAATLVVNAYLIEYEKGNREITPEIMWNRVKEHIGKGVGFSIVMVAAVIVATMFFLLPGIYVGVTLSLMYMVMMRENLGLEATFRRCFYLINDKWWSTFGLLMIMGIISGIIGYVFQIPTMIVTFSSILQIGDGINTFWTTVGGVIGTVGSVLVRSLVLVAIGFQYYNLVERRDGSGILGAIEDIGKNDTPRIDRREEEF